MEVVVRATVVYFLLWLVTRGVGKRELAEMTAFELILLVTVGDLVQQGVTQEDMSITGAMLAVGTFVFWIVVFAYLTWRSPSARPVLEGLPVVIVRNGEPLEQVLRLERVALDEVREEARQQGISDLSEVRLCVLEPDGKFSFLQSGGGSGGQQQDQKHQT